ncbi:MAG: branched-chain amino acid ABC transporter permease, partial [Candidatus Jordarchaeaceae archaeon]
IVVFIFATLASLIFYFFLKRTLTGKAMRAIIENTTGATALGIDVSKIYALSFGLGFGMAGVAGSLVSMLFTLTPTIGMEFTAVAFFVIILGGLKNMLGSLISSFIIAAIQIFSSYYTNPGFAWIIIYIAFIFILIVRPEGLLKS